jgi:hypothetical protein
VSDLRKPIVFPEVDCDGTFGSVLGDRDDFSYAELQNWREEAWARRAAAYEEKPDFLNSWHWLNEHPVFYAFGDQFHERALDHSHGVQDGLEFMVVMVNPATDRISDNEAENTRLEVWVEVFPTSLSMPHGSKYRLHAYECDTGGATYEEAVVKMAQNIYERYGHDRVALTKEWSGA